MLVLLVCAWEVYVDLAEVPPYILPAPARIGADARQRLAACSARRCWSRCKIDLHWRSPLRWSAASRLAILFAQSRWIELRALPLRRDPAGDADRRHRAADPHLRRSDAAALLICAWIVAFFPILSNTTHGPAISADHNLLDLFELYGATPLADALATCSLPSALPYFLAGLQIAGGLALIGAVVAEFAAGTAGAGSGLAFRIVESAVPAATSRACSRRWLLLSADRHR